MTLKELKIFDLLELKIQSCDGKVLNCDIYEWLHWIITIMVISSIRPLEWWNLITARISVKQVLPDNWITVHDDITSSLCPERSLKAEQLGERRIQETGLFLEHVIANTKTVNHMKHSQPADT